jgi:hypothetical protein
VSGQLDELIALRDLTFDEAAQRLDLSDDNVEDGLQYEGLKGMTMAHNPERHPGRFYFRDGRLAMLYVAKPDVDAGTLERELGEPDVTLRSRAGKGYAHHVYADRGIAYSSRGDDVAFVELFSPTSVERYEQEIYEDPGAFIR